MASGCHEYEPAFKVKGRQRHCGMSIAQWWRKIILVAMVSMHIAGKRLVNICIEYCANITMLHFFKGAPAHFYPARAARVG